MTPLNMHTGEILTFKKPLISHSHFKKPKARMYVSLAFHTVTRHFANQNIAKSDVASTSQMPGQRPLFIELGLGKRPPLGLSGCKP